MTKTIIIDGVNVAECAYFDYENNGEKDSCYIHDNECSAQNCYYKQLQRIKSDKKYIYKIAQKLRTKTDYHSPDEVNADIDEILRITKDV